MFGRDKNDVIETLPMVPLRDVVVFPHMMIPFVIGRQSSIRALDHALARGKRIFLSAQHDATRDNPGPEEIYTLGTVCSIVQSLKLPDGNVKVLVEGLDRARALEFREEGGSLKVVAKVVPRSEEPAAGMEGLMSKVIGLFEQYVKLSNNLHYDAMLAAVRVEDPGQARRHHLLPPRRPGGGEAEPPRDLLRAGAAHPHRLHPRGRGRQAQRRPPHPGPRQEADGAGAEGVLPQREDEGDPEGARPQGRPHERGGRAAQEGRAGAHAQGRGGEGAPGAEAPRVDAAHVGRGHRLPQLPRLADRRPLDEEDPRAEGPPRGRADPERGPLRAREGQGADRRVPGRAPAGEQPEGPDPLLRRPPRGRQDLARPLDRPLHEPQVRAPLARRRARRGRDPRPPPHLHRRLPRPDHPDDEEGGRAQPRLPPRRGGQDVHGLPGRPLAPPCSRSSTRSRTTPSPTTTSTSSTTSRRSSSSPPRTCCTRSPRPCRTAWR